MYHWPLSEGWQQHGEGKLMLGKNSAPDMLGYVGMDTSIGSQSNHVCQSVMDEGQHQ